MTHPLHPPPLHLSLSSRPSPPPSSSPSPPPYPPASSARAPHPSASSKSISKPSTRPVFLSAALSRTLRLPWRRRLRATRAILSFILSDASWWLSRGIWTIPASLRASRRARSLPLHPNIPTPSVDVYAPVTLSSALSHALSAPCGHPLPSALATRPVILFVHGGAWGAGQASHFSQLATELADRSHAIVHVLAYRLYPTAKISHQADDVTAALRHIRMRFPTAPLVLLAHSSGAHITALALSRAAGLSSNEKIQIEQRPLADIALLAAAPMHLMHHFLFEARRGVADVSPMLPAACADKDAAGFHVVSPTVLAERSMRPLSEPSGLPTIPPALEGEIAAANLPLPSVKRERESKDEHMEMGIFPRTYLLTSSSDTVVPMYSSVRYVAALRNLGLPAQLLVYDGVDHIDFITDWFRDGVERDLSDLLDVDPEDAQRRRDVVRELAGDDAAQLLQERERARGPTAYVRDVLRIIESLTPNVEEGEDEHEHDELNQEGHSDSTVNGKSDIDDVV